MQFPPLFDRRFATVVVLVMLSCGLHNAPSLRAASRLDELVGQLESRDRFSRHRAEAELLQQGDALLPEIVARLREGTPDHVRVLTPIFDELLSSFLDDYEIDVSAVRNATMAFRRLSKLPSAAPAKEEGAETDAEQTGAAGGNRQGDEELAERRQNLREQLTKLGERLRGHRELLGKLIPAALPTVLRRSLFHVSPPDPFEEVLQASLRDLSEDEIAPVASDPTRYAVRRYELAPFWHWILERSELWERVLKAQLEAGKTAASGGDDTEGSDDGKAAAEERTQDLPKEALDLIRRARELSPLLASRLEDHMERSFQDLLSGDFRRRELAEDTFFLLGKRGISFLEKHKASDGGHHSEYLLELLRWRVHPRVRERTGMDFRDFGLLSFRERRRFIISYVRAAGKDSAPTLRAIVNDESLEPLNRVKLTAAEALAGLGDLRAILELRKRRIPELMKIPEISREFFLLQGLKYQEDQQYELAIQEFQKILDESPFHFQATYHIAFAYLLAKNYKKSIHHFVIARRIRPQDSLTLYNLACAYSLAGQIDNGLEALEASIDAGFTDHGHISKDPDLNPLRQEDKFKEMLKALEGVTVPAGDR
jgi:tetratricopeptide (TPR) repeat protein